MRRISHLTSYKIPKFKEETIRFFMALAFIMSFCFSTQAQMAKGSIMVVGYDGDGIDHLIFMVLKNIPNGEVIFISDNEWNGTSFNFGEGALLWNNNTGGDILAGTVVTLMATSPQSIDYGTVSSVGSGTFSLTTSGDDITLYQGSAWNTVPSNFITMFSSGPDATHTLTGTGLTHGVDAIDDSAFNNLDVICYNGSFDCSGGDLVACSSLFANSSNYQTQDGSGDQSEDGSAPDLPGCIAANPGFQAPLPIKLNWFTAEARTKETIVIKWQTAIEINNDYMIVEHKGPGDDEFSEIDRVNGQGNSISPVDYSIVHNDPAIGHNYYRLIQVDYDGAVSTHQTVSTLIENESEHLSIYPMPVKDFVSVQINSDNREGFDLFVHDYSGRLISSDKIPSDEAVLHLNWSNLRAGLYIISLKSAYHFEQHRIIKI